MDKIQVIIISQQSLFRQGIAHSLEDQADIEISGTTEASEKLLSEIDTLAPDVALVDIDGQNGGGLTFARRIRQHSPSTGVIVLTSSPADDQLFEAIKAQASAFVSKEITADQLVDAVRRVARGEHPINENLTARPKVAEQVLHQFQKLTWKNEAEGFILPLTPREKEILNYIAQGDLNKQIATKLEISEQTIKNHVTSILRKLNANARTEAVVIAIKQGLVTIS